MASILLRSALLSLAAAAAVAAGPAAANSDARCTVLADQARTAAATADAASQSKAQRFVATGVKLCEAGNERAAAKQFRAALRATGTAEQADARLAQR